MTEKRLWEPSQGCMENVLKMLLSCVWPKTLERAELCERERCRGTNATWQQYSFVNG